MKRAFATLLLLSAGFGIFLTAGAQFQSTEPLSLVVTPTYPRPYQSVIVVPESNIIDLTASTVTTLVNGQVVSTGSGAEAAAVRTNWRESATC